MTSKRIPIFFLRFGLAFVLLYAGAAGFLQPSNWIGFIPQWMRDSAPLGMSENALLSLVSGAEVVFGVLLLLGIQVFLIALLSAIFLLAIVIFNWGAFDAIFRDVGLFFAALALVFLSRHSKV